ncbi:MAG: helix-turn-helix domain-containing protein [Pseudoxanthomonas sp.]
MIGKYSGPMAMQAVLDDGNTLAAAFRIEVPRIVVHKFQKSSLALTEVQGGAHHGITDSIPYDDAYLVQLRLVDCMGCNYFSEGKYVENVDRRAGMIQIHDLRRDPIVDLIDPFHALHCYMPQHALTAATEEMRSTAIDELQVRSSQTLVDPVIRNLLLAVLPALKDPASVSALFVDHVAFAITAHVAQAYGGASDRSKASRGGLAAWQERLAKDLLDAAVDTDISLSRLALECSLSTRHFARAFHQSVGMPPHRYLLKRRIDRAKQLLQFSRQSLSEIATACGFADQSHFTRVFRAAVDMTPGAWRRLKGGFEVDTRGRH